MIPNAPLRAVILDMGGVLVDFGGGRGLPPEAEDWRGRRAMLRLAEKHGRRSTGWTEVDLEREVFAPWRVQYQRRHNTGREASWTPHLDRLRDAYHLNVGDEELLAAWFRPYLEELSCTTSARQVVGTLVDRDLACGLVSNVPLPGAIYRPLLERQGLWDLLSVRCFSYDEGVRKPSPAIVRRALTSLDVAPEEAVMVGDRKASDVAVGRMAGMPTVWLESRFDDGPEPDAVIEALDRLPSLLASWNQPGEESS